MSDAAAVKSLFDAAESAFGGIDVLINSASTMRLSPWAETDDDAFGRQLDVNLKGSFHIVREAARRLRHGGRIVNISISVVGKLFPTYGVYTATKVGVEALTATLARRCVAATSASTP